MAKTKEGRRRMSRLDFSSEAGRTLFYALSHPSESKFSPFLESDHQSKRFWESNKLFQQVSFPAFRGHAAEMAKIAIAQMTPETKKAEKARIAKLPQAKATTPKKSTNSVEINESPQPPTVKELEQKSQENDHSNVTSLRDTIVASHPNSEMAIIIFELDGDTDDEACQLQFAKGGRKIKVYSRIPTELTNAASLLGISENRSTIKDADCMLLDLSIKQRLKGSRKDSNGDYWEIREIIDLPFQCKNSIFNKHRKEIPTYLIRKNDHGYAWGYFWVVASHVGQKEKSPGKIPCQADSDIESFDENRSQLFSSDEEQDDNVDEMEIEFQATSFSNQSEQLKENLEAEIVQLRKSIELKTEEAMRLKSASNTFINSTIPELQKQVQLKNEEIAKLQDNFMCELTGLKGRLECEQRKYYELESNSRQEKEELLCQLNSEKQQVLLKNGELNDMQQLLEQEKRKSIILDMKVQHYHKERDQYLQKLNILENDLQAQERGKLTALQNSHENIHHLESEIQRLSSENQSKDKLIKELRSSCKSKDQEHHRLEHSFKENLDEMAQRLHESNEQMNNLKTEAAAQIEHSKRKLEESYEKYQGFERVILEKEQQCRYQVDQIEKLNSHLFEMEQSVLQKDVSINSHLRETQGLKSHILHQGSRINELEKELQRLRNLRSGIRLTSETYTDEEKKIEFNELNRWDSDKSLKTVTPKNLQSPMVSPRKMQQSFVEKDDGGDEVQSSEVESKEEGKKSNNQDQKDFDDVQSEVIAEEKQDVSTEEEVTYENQDQKDFDDVQREVMADEKQDVSEEEVTYETQDQKDFDDVQSEVMADEKQDVSTEEEVTYELTDGKQDESTEEVVTSVNDDQKQDKRLTAVHDSTDSSTFTEMVSKKRKSVTDLRFEHPNKRIRKSKRLEEKRLARQMKAKID